MVAESLNQLLIRPLLTRKTSSYSEIHTELSKLSWHLSRGEPSSRRFHFKIKPFTVLQVSTFGHLRSALMVVDRTRAFDIIQLISTLRSYVKGVQRNIVRSGTTDGGDRSNPMPNTPSKKYQLLSIELLEQPTVPELRYLLDY